MSITPRANQRPVVGMIVPPAAGEVPPEPLAMYSNDIDFIAEGLGLKRLTPDGYDQVIGQIADVSKRLKQRGATAIALMGTSLSFYQGPEFHHTLTQEIEQTTGLRATTMSTAIVDALRAVGATKIAVGTAYVDSVNERLHHFLVSSGFDVSNIESLAIDDVSAIKDIDNDTIVQLGRDALEKTPDAQALFLSCGGLQTLAAVKELEAEFAGAVITSATAGAWGAAKLVGHDGVAKKFGRLTQ